MKTSAVVIILLSHQGYWFGGQQGQLTLRWATVEGLADTVLVWDLMLADARISGDRVAISAEKRPSTISITPPAVRVRTPMRWVYRIIQRKDGKEIARGEKTIHVFPKNLLKSISSRTKDKKIFVWDSQKKLPKLLTEGKITHKVIKHPSELQFKRSDIVLVAADQIDRTPFIQSSLLGQAQAGAGVLFFEQKRAPMLAGYMVARRPAPKKLEWKQDHPLLSRFRAEDLQSWFVSRDKNLMAIQLPKDEPALEIGYWAREVKGDKPVPIDAVLVTKKIGEGRLVLSQIPLGDFENDPRSQLFLANAINYLLTRPEDTLRPSKREVNRPSEPERVPTITIPSGGTP